ncbi:MAG: DNA polymerase IV, partial [Proteobacteria bacterium]|nr:DNA polymerase IV [Pseudomonadota bacterium]
IGAAEAERFLAPRPVSIIPGVGPAFAASLQKAGFKTVGDVARADPKVLAERFGAGGLRLADLARGRDSRAVDPGQARKSLSAETTFNEDLTRLSDLEDQLWPLCEKVARHARAESIAGRVVTLKLRDSVFRITTRRKTLPIATQTAKTLFQLGRELLKPEVGTAAYRLIGIGISDLVDGDLATSDFFAGAESRALQSEKALDALRARFGAEAVISGRALKRGPPAN